MASISKTNGCLFGLAFGDAYGAPTEFLSYEQILSMWPVAGPADLDGDLIRVTDDTQMALAVGEALIACKSAGLLTPDGLEKTLRHAFVQWFRSPDNNRAPGMTCLRACEALQAGKPWLEATVSASKGCGANMRVPPVGLLQPGQCGLTQAEIAAIAQFQAALTHGHPTALTASDLTARTVAYLYEGEQPSSIVSRLREYAVSQRRVYHDHWLGALYQRAGEDSPESFIERGWLECLSVLDRLDAATAYLDYSGDPCLATGAGWVAEEALATGLLCFLMYPDEPRMALHRAATTSGDSDSIACMTGAFAGAYHGAEVWPGEWLSKIEYRSRLSNVAAALAD
jgi:ADP-ribosylglycohydrolase